MVAIPTQEQLRQRLVLTEDDIRTLYIIAAYAAGIFVLWNFPLLKHLLYPFKLVVTLLHEFGHAAAGKCTGAKIRAIKIEQDTSGVTEMIGGNPYITLPAGYLGSSFFGGLMIFAGFDILGSKIVSGFLAVCFLASLYWAKNWIARIMPVLCIGLLAFLWWFETSKYLPYAVLFIGVMCALQSLWDFQGLLFFKHPQSDATKYAELCGRGSSRFWGFIWMVVALVFMCAFTFLGVFVF